MGVLSVVIVQAMPFIESKLQQDLISRTGTHLSRVLAVLG